ncbi:MAG: ABC transporter ATP-binding protein [Caldilineaceae bacterium]|nr:ABC transporter ATP-binding protein [Caldilineaceae bacterium]
MSQVAISVENVSKQYRLGAIGGQTLRADFSRWWAARRGLPDPTLKIGQQARINSENSLLWALRGINLEVAEGEVVGIIGRNGAGKSTLLKILSRITAPTSGQIKVRGRIGSLLEVGTGFHPELTGRENVYLNGAILGMRKEEITRKFDEIVDFSDVEQFIDTPVKRYSSGMQVRLAFAVAAHLDPEILLVDEVLAVGDAAFRKKCLGKMNDVARTGRTVLFVSHNLGTIVNLCPRSVLLVDGEKVADGPSEAVVNEYIGRGPENPGEIVWNDPENAPGSDAVRLHAVRLINNGEVTSDIDIQHDLQVEIEYWTLKPDLQLTANIQLMDKLGAGVLSTANMRSANLIEDEWCEKPHPVGLYRSTCIFPGNFLNEGLYYINVHVLRDISRIEVGARDVISFVVNDTGAMRQEYGGTWMGVVRPKFPWQTEQLNGA